MRYRECVDPFLNKQPETGFISELTKPYHTEMPAGFGEVRPEGEYLDLSRINICIEFPDECDLLESAYSDLREFCRVSGIEISESGVPLIIAECKTECREAYLISVEADKLTLSAADTEGIRRAVYYIEDEMKRQGGAWLPIGEISKKPFIKSRISRCFFAPPSHASNKGMVNELASEIDYYPEEYLSRLAHDGINGLWIGASLHDLLKSEVIPEYGEDSERRIEKLRQVTERCGRYGIGVYLLSVEPGSGYHNPIFEKYSEYHGQKGYEDYHLFCPSTEGCLEYIGGAMRRLFTLVPALSGFINISTGECLSGCGSAAELTCPRCKKKYGTLGATLAATEKAFSDAILEVKPEAEFISWTYSQRVWREDDIAEACRLRVGSVIHMQNFEDFGKCEQLSEERYAFDYWLSFVGPGEVMKKSLEVNRERGVKTYAKLQVCSSHEIASVPYVPVPGILYDKYKAMREGGISGAVLCWYFGNYPCMMGKAASELSFEPFPESKDSFLKQLAGIYWGRDAARAAEAFRLFEMGYSNYPVSQSFEWFGPMQDSPAVPLHLIPVDMPMPSTWLLDNMVGGDRIGECLTDGHTLSEARELSGRMSALWDEGVKILESIPSFEKYERAEQQSCASAINLLFKSGYNILRFYELRHRLGICVGNNSAILSEIREIVRAEIEISKALIPLCEADLRLGYHSEAHGYKFFPEKLLWRIEELEKLLAEEFPRVEKRIEEGLAPLAFYMGEGAEKVVHRGLSATFYAEGTYRCTDGRIVTPDEKYAEGGLGCQGAAICAADAAALGGAVSEEAEGEGCGFGASSIPEFVCQFEAEYFSEPKTTVLYREENGVISLEFTLYDSEGDSLHIRPEFHLFHPSGHIYLGGGRLDIPEQRNYSLLGERLRRRRAAFTLEYSSEKSDSLNALSCGRTERYKISFKRGALLMAEGEPFRLAVKRTGKHGESLGIDDRKYKRLIQGEYSPDAFILFI